MKNEAELIHNLCLLLQLLLQELIFENVSLVFIISHKRNSPPDKISKTPMWGPTKVIPIIPILFTYYTSSAQFDSCCSNSIRIVLIIDYILFNYLAHSTSYKPQRKKHSTIIELAKTTTLILALSIILLSDVFNFNEILQCFILKGFSLQDTRTEPRSYELRRNLCIVNKTPLGWIF